MWCAVTFHLENELTKFSIQSSAVFHLIPSQTLFKVYVEVCGQQFFIRYFALLALLDYVSS